MKNLSLKLSSEVTSLDQEEVSTLDGGVAIERPFPTPFPLPFPFPFPKPIPYPGPVLH